MIADGSRRLVVNINDLRRKNPARAESLLNHVFEEQVAFEKGLKEFVITINHEYAKTQDEFFIAFEGSFGNKHVTPRNLTSSYLGNLICVEGIVTKCKMFLSFLKPPYLLKLFCVRLSCPPKSSKKCALLCCNKEDHGKKVYRSDFNGSIPHQFSISYQG